ncbi:MAG: hypothetical protein WDM81_01200 [Rhizomicrobium sp.]
MNRNSQAKAKCQSRPSVRFGEALGIVAPAGEAAHRLDAVGVRHAEDAVGVEGPRSDLRHAPEIDVVALGGHRQDGVVEVGCYSPIERGMGVENLQAGHQHDQHAYGIDPVQYAHRNRVAVEQISRLARSARSHAQGGTDAVDGLADLPQRQGLDCVRHA